MESHRVTCMLVIDGGPSRRVGPAGALIGRDIDCDVVTSDPSVSRRHALVRLSRDGVELVPLGRSPVDINGKPKSKPTALEDGDTLTLPGLKLTVQINLHRPAPGAASSFRLELARGGSFGIVHSPFVIGGGSSDDLVVKGWPARLLVLHVAQRELFLEATATKATLNGQPIEPEVPTPLVVGDVIGFKSDSFTVHQHAPHAATTAVVAPSALPSRVVVEILARGGRVVFSMPDGDHPVFLHDRRLDLLVALLRPPAGHAAGDFVPDDLVASIVWPRNTGTSRNDMNQLIRRCRLDLVEAGLAGPRLIERAPTGGATRIALAPGAQVIVDG